MRKDNRDIEKRIRKEAKNVTPEVWDEVQKDIKNGKGKVVDMPVNKRKGKLINLISTIAAAFVLISITAYAITNYDRIDKNVASNIYIEVNPQIELSLNAYNKVLNATAKNAEGKKVLGTMEFEGSQLEVALNAILGSMLKNGYLTAESNTVLISVENEDRLKTEQIQKDLLKTVSQPINNDFKVAAIVQKAKYDDELKNTADSLHITSGKAEFIEFMQKNGVKATKEDLAKLSVHELNLIFQSSKTHDVYEYINQDDYDIYGGLGYKGIAKDTKYITIDKVKEIVFKDAGVTEKEIRDFEAELDFDYGKMVYEVEFEKGNTEYDYLLDATSGGIMTSLNKKPNFGKNENSSKPSVSSAPSVSSKPTASSKPSVSSKPTESKASSKPAASSESVSSVSQNNTSYNIDAIIAPEKALEYARIHAGVDKNAIREPDVEIDMERGEPYHYDVEFEANGYEYDYEIDAISGKVIKSEKDTDD